MNLNKFKFVRVSYSDDFAIKFRPFYKSGLGGISIIMKHPNFYNNLNDIGNHIYLVIISGPEINGNKIYLHHWYTTELSDNFNYIVLEKDIPEKIVRVPQFFNNSDIDFISTRIFQICSEFYNSDNKYLYNKIKKDYDLYNS